MKLPELPEMVFGYTTLRIQHKESGFAISFNAHDALHEWIKACEAGLVPRAKLVYADAWARSRSVPEDLDPNVKDFEWTFSTPYCGSVELGRSGEGRVLSPPDADADADAETTSHAASHAQVDLAELTRPDPIRFLAEFILFEDELADNGVSLLTVKVRVMPRCFFVRMRLWMRVDGSLCRMYDTRVYHRFGTDHVVRQIQHRENTYEELRKVISCMCMCVCVCVCVCLCVCVCVHAWGK
jgi:type 2A phosphatase activator TIP41